MDFDPYIYSFLPVQPCTLYSSSWRRLHLHVDIYTAVGCTVLTPMITGFSMHDKRMVTVVLEPPEANHGQSQQERECIQRPKKLIIDSCHQAALSSLPHSASDSPPTTLLVATSHRLAPHALIASAHATRTIILYI